MPKKPQESKSLIALQRSRQAHVDRLKERGFKAKTFWLSPEALAALERLKGEPNFADNGRPSEGAAVNAALIEAARRLGDADDDRELPPLTNAELKAIVASMGIAPSQGLKEDGAPPQKDRKPKPTKTPAKTVKAVKAVREAAEPVVGAKLDIPVGPQPFKARLKTPKGSK